MNTHQALNLAHKVEKANGMSVSLNQIVWVVVTADGVPTRSIVRNVIKRQVTVESLRTGKKYRVLAENVHTVPPVTIGKRVWAAGESKGYFNQNIAGIVKEIKPETIVLMHPMYGFDFEVSHADISFVPGTIL
ncbi:MAG: hypothetical protein FOGNACKC_00798 [Anaerolineae bacterium]|nr:hypothetical protein [Anaerolineae bacterium]